MWEEECWECGSNSCDGECLDDDVMEDVEGNTMSSQGLKAQQVMEILWDFERGLSGVELPDDVKSTLKAKFDAYYLTLELLGGSEDSLSPARTGSLL